MKGFLLDVLKTIFTSALGVFFGCIFTKLFSTDKQKSNIVVDKQINFIQIQQQQKINIYNQSTSTRRYQKRRADSQDNTYNIWELIIVLLIVSVYLIYIYIKYEHGIVVFMNILNSFVGTMLLTSTYMTIKKYKKDKTLKTILIFNGVAIICSFLLLYFAENPIMYKEIDKQVLFTQMKEKGMFEIIKNVQAFGFILYQLIGMVFIFVVILFMTLGTIHVLATVNLTMQTRLTKMWRLLFKISYGLCRNIKAYIVLGSILLVAAFFFISGVLSKLLYVG